MKACVVRLVFVLAAVGCSSSRLSPGDYLDGAWGAPNNPGGSGISLSLATLGSKVMGTGEVCGGGPRACSPGSVTITGQRLGVGFQLTVHDGSGVLATYSGQLIGQNELQGAWTEANDSGTLTLYRR